MKKYYYVYKIINLINQHEYIGFHSTNNLNDGYMGSGKLLPYAYAKYGIENFKKIILKMFKTKEDAEAYERELVNLEYVNRPDTYNISLGGNVCILYGKRNGFYGKKHSPETQQRIIAKLNKYYETHDGAWKNKNISEDDDVIIDGIRYFSIYDAQRKLNIKYKQLRNLLLKEGNGFTDAIRQANLVKEYEHIILNRKLTGLRLLKYTQDPERNKKISASLTGRKHPWQDKINKNPEKIAKTAAKHTGMKRSAESCRRMSISTKEYYKTHDAYNKDMIFIHNTKTDKRKYISKNETIPSGWKIGLGSTKAKGKKWYMNPNDFSQTKNFSDSEQIPLGWIPGNGNLRLAKLKKRKI